MACCGASATAGFKAEAVAREIPRLQVHRSVEEVAPHLKSQSTFADLARRMSLRRAVRHQGSGKLALLLHLALGLGAAMSRWAPYHMCLQAALRHMMDCTINSCLKTFRKALIRSPPSTRLAYSTQK